MNKQNECIITLTPKQQEDLFELIPKEDSIPKHWFLLSQAWVNVEFDEGAEDLDENGEVPVVFKIPTLKFKLFEDWVAWILYKAIWLVNYIQYWRQKKSD